jgi:dTMP kinase
MEQNKYFGKFIVFEGLDGSGQTTQANLLVDFLKQKRGKALLTKEPTVNSPFSKKIREVLKKKEKILPRKLQELFAQDRRWHLKNIILPNLKKGMAVVTDRYLFSSFAFGTASGVDYKYIAELNKDFLLPNLVFFLDVSPKNCLQRIERRGREKELFERKDRLEKVYSNYKKVLNDFKNKSKIYLIRGEKPISSVFKEIKNKIKTEKII